MHREVRERRKAQLALAIAQGVSIADWARGSQVSQATAYRWARERKVCELISSYRRRAIDREISQIAERATGATARIATIANEANSEAVQLSACQAILSTMRPKTKLKRLEKRIAKLEEEHFRDQPGNADRAS